MNLSGSILDYFIVFWAGVLVSFSPCVYPVIPITASFIAAANTSGTKLRGFTVSLIYVLGLAITYCTLGVFASLTGKMFGSIQNNPAIFLIIGCVFVFFSLVLFDKIPIPAFGAQLRSKVRIRNLWTVLLFGVVSGFVIGQCTAPIFGALLTHVATKQDLPYTISLLFVFSYGAGASLILVGSFSGLLSSLPKSGPWMVVIKRFCAVTLFIIGIYFFVKAGRFFL